MLDEYINKIINADCMDILPKIPDHSIDLVLTDAPYGVRKKEDWDDKEYFENNINVWLNECFRVAKSGVLWFCAGKSIASIFAHCKANLFHSFHRIITWSKPLGSQFAGAMHNNIWYSTEFILVFDMGNLTAKGKDSSFQLSAIESRTIPFAEFQHPTTKPIDLIRILIEHYSDEGDIILDMFLGSGTTTVACKQLKRNYIGIERDPEYFKIAQNRMSQGVLHDWSK